MPSVAPAGAARSPLALLTGVARDERAALAWSFLYFFALLCSYGLLRPLREEMGVRHGVERFVELLMSDLLRVELAVMAERAAVGRLLRKYADRPMSLADACLVRMSETLPEPIIITTDSDFRIYRRHSRQVVPCLLP